MHNENIIQVSPSFTLNLRECKIKRINSEEISYEFGSKKAARLIFQDRMQGWFFEPAIKLLDDNCAVAAVHLVTPLIEALEIYSNGKTGKRDFRNQAEKIFQYICKKENKHFKDNTQCRFCISERHPLCEKSIKLLYYGVRCGFSHQGFMQQTDYEEKSNIILSLKNNEYPIIYEAETLTIYVSQYIKYIEKAFEKYYKKIEEDNDASDKFLKIWNKHWNMKKNTFGFGVDFLQDHSPSPTI
ncbi:MAG: hypothetical protein NW214_13490 [Pseudanabaenaceae cyanobacterium bins.39]|nr:hypothetical protein [Pseudanabaenaceae cyanobacterium bins.39]